MKKVFEAKIVCTVCNGTGVYVGMAERDGAGIVCARCKGTGCYHHKFEYEEFKERKTREGIRRIYQTNPGIMIGENILNGITLEDFGGIPYDDWLAGCSFPVDLGCRKFICPRWAAQAAGISMSINWKKYNCSIDGDYYSSCKNCKNFGIKEKCWNIYDIERIK